MNNLPAAFTGIRGFVKSHHPRSNQVTRYSDPPVFWN